MCALYTISPNPRIFEIGGFSYSFPEMAWPERIFPGTAAPVFTYHQAKMMRFSLIPSWSKDSKIKFATHNARIETVLEKPTWRKPFEKNHCLVPINAFIEPIREGDYAGNMVRFVSAEPMMAAAIFDEWLNKETGEVIESFAILTKEPTPFVAKIGHDRQPIFLTDNETQAAWLSTNTQTPLAWQHFLSTVDNVGRFEIEIERKLKA